MNTVNVNIEELKSYIDAGFAYDKKILGYYDQNQIVETIEDVCNNVYKKIKIEYPLSLFVGVEKDGVKIGYYVCYKKTLVSFSLNVEYRNKENLKDFFELIKTQFGSTFQVLLFTYNTRAIKWLKTCGLHLLCENVSLLQFDNN